MHLSYAPPTPKILTPRSSTRSMRSHRMPQTNRQNSANRRPI